MNMRGILDVDFVCLKEIFKFLTPLDFCSMRQSCTQLRWFVDDYCRLLYFTREQWLHITQESIRKVSRILKNLGKFVRRLYIGNLFVKPNLLLDVIATNCRDVLTTLSLHDLKLEVIHMERLAELFNNLEILQLLGCYGDQKCFESILLRHEYPNLTELTIRYSDCDTEVLQKFFMRTRNIKKLGCGYVNGDILPLICLNAPEMEELNFEPEDDKNLMLVTQLSKLKRLEIACSYCDPTAIIALIKGLSANNEFEMLSLRHFELTDEFCDALSNLTNVKKLRLWFEKRVANDTKPIELLSQKLPKLECLMMVDCSQFRNRNFLASACKSDKFRTVYVSHSFFREIDKFLIVQMLKNFSDDGHRCFVAGDPLRIIFEKEMFNNVKRLLTHDNLQSILKNGNIKILPVNDGVFYN